MRFRLLAVLALLVSFAVQAQQPSYPNRPVRVVVPFPPGGLADVVARVIAQKLAENLGQSFIIENRGGATGTIGSAVVAKTPADGYTLLSSGSTTAAVAPHLYSNLPYNQEKDLVGVGRIGAVSSIVLLHPSVPASTMSELIALMKAKPGTINFGSGGSGGSQHIGAELLKTLTGVSMTHVPYKGGGPAMVDLIAGQIALMIEPTPTALPQIRAGKVKALAVTTPQRSSAIPDLPTMAEAGVPGYDLRRRSDCRFAGRIQRVRSRGDGALGQGGARVGNQARLIGRWPLQPRRYTDPRNCPSRKP
jgi:tripartite-type tricarboxylate transporter receptor subunit TctC